MRQKRISAALTWLALIGSVGAMMILLSYIALYSDDYQYSTFFRGGLGAFWQKTVDHYLTVNGRALVHFVAEVFLLFGTRLYALLFPVMMALAFSLGSTVQGDGTARFAPGAAAVSLCLMLALPVEYLNQTLCWIAGSFNYCFPALLILGYFALELRSVRGGGVAWACVLGLLAGATTEQNGLMALLGGGLIALCALLRAPRGERPWRSVLSVPFVLAGYLSILLAPGTASRISFDGDNAGTLAILLNPELLAERFYSVMAYFCGTGRSMPAAAWLLTVLMLLLGFLPFVCRRRNLRLLSAGLPLVVCYLLLLLLGGSSLTTVTAQLIVCLYLALAGCCLLFDRELWMSGVLLLCGLAAIGIMIFTNLGAYRTVVPTLIMLIAVLVRLAQVYLARLPEPARIAAGAAVIVCCALTALPTFRGYRTNHAVAERNEAAIETGKANGEIILCTDYLDRYRHTLMYEGVYFFSQFKLCYEIPNDIPIHLEGEHYLHFPTVIDGTSLRRHSVMTNAVLWLPMVELCETLGATCVWDFERGSGFYLTLEGEQYYLSEQENNIRHIATGEIVVEECYTTGIADASYIDVSSAAAFFGVEYYFDWQAVALYTNERDTIQ